MNARYTGNVIALVALVVAALACNLPTPTPAAPTVYVLPEPTALPEEVTPTLEPAPEGDLLVVYTDEGSLWIVAGESAARRLTSGGADSDPLFSPDGRWILFRRQLPPSPADLPRFELRIIGADGSDERRVVGPEDLPGEMGMPIESDVEVLLDRLPLQVTWLPDSRAVAFNTRIEGGYGLIANDDLWLVDIETGALTALLPDGEGGSFAFSPDGARLVACTPTTVTMMGADGTNRRELVTFDFVNTASEYAYHPMPAWAPDSSYALVAISSPEPFAPGASGNVWRLPVSGDTVLLATLPGNFLFATMGNALWSPDRTRIAYTAPAAGGGPNTRDLIIAGVDGSDPVVYATGELDFQGWTPTGHRFTFWQNQPGELYLGQIAEPPQRLVGPGEADRIQSLRWADGETFAYVTGEWGAFIFRVGQVGGAHRTIGTSNDGFAQLDVYW